MGCCYNAYPQICKWLWDWEMDRNWKHFWMHGENSLDCIEENVGRNIDNVGNTGEGLDGNEDHGRESCCLGENIYHCKQNHRNIKVKGISGEVSEIRNTLVDTGGKEILIIK